MGSVGRARLGPAAVVGCVRFRWGWISQVVWSRPAFRGTYCLTVQKTDSTAVLSLKAQTSPIDAAIACRTRVWTIAPNRNCDSRSASAANTAGNASCTPRSARESLASAASRAYILQWVELQTIRFVYTSLTASVEKVSPVPRWVMLVSHRPFRSSTVGFPDNEVVVDRRARTEVLGALLLVEWT